MKKYVRSSSQARLALSRLYRYSVSDSQIVDTLCAKLVDHMDEDPDMTFEDAYNYVLNVDWEDNLFPRVKERLQELGIWTHDEDTIRDAF